jgi:hypothetical protein
MEKTTNVFNKGIFTDTDELNQPQGTIRFGLNSQLEAKEGSLNDVSSEEGNEICSELPEGYEIIGDSTLDNNDKLLILSNNITSIIGIQDCLCQFKVLIKSSCFGWKTYKPLDKVWRLKGGCSRIFYITDGLNKIYNINIDELKIYLSEEVINDNALETDEDKINYTNENDLWDCEKLKLFPNIKLPRLYLDAVLDSGGRIPVGTIAFTIRYLDADLNPTHWLYDTNFIDIVDETLSSDYNIIDGGISGQQDLFEDNSNALPPTTKSVRLKIEELDNTFVYYQIGVLESTSGLGIIDYVRVLPQRLIPTSLEEYFTYTGPNSTSDTTTSIADVVQPRTVIDGADHIDQIDNTLLLLNTKEKVRDWSKFQKYASKIGTKYITIKGSKDNIANLSPKSPTLYFEYKTHMRDEIYPYSILYLFNDATLSPAFHVPGRPIDANPLTCETIGSTLDITTTQKCLVVTLPPITHPGSLLYIGLNYTIDGVTKSYITNVDITNYNLIPYRHVIECFETTSVVEVTFFLTFYVNAPTPLLPTAAFYGIENNINTTSTATSAANIPNPILGWDSTEYDYDINNPNHSYIPIPQNNKIKRWEAYNTAIKLTDSSGIMSYWESKNTYPPIKDCDGESIWGTDVCGNLLENTPIRHHKFPDASLEPIQNDTELIYMGVEFFNIEIPQEYADEIVGYYIVRGIRDEINKTVLDKGILDRTEYYKGVPTQNSQDESHYTYLRSATSLDNSGTFGRDYSTVVFHSPKGFFNRDSFIATHYKTERMYNVSQAPNMLAWGPSSRQFRFFRFHNEGDVSPINFLSSPITQSKYVDRIEINFAPTEPVGTTLEGYKVINYLVSNPFYISRLSRNVTFGQDSGLFPDTFAFYASIKSYRDVFSNLETIKYQMTHHNYVNKNATSFKLFGGDTFISKLDFTLQDLDESRSYMSAYVESEINSELRHDGIDICDTHYKGSYNVNQTQTGFTSDPPHRKWLYRFNQSQEFEDAEVPEKFYSCHDYWAYNPSFSISNIERVFFHIPFSFNYCKKCLGEFPYRIYYSLRSFQEEQVDSYKVILPNNYTDILGDQGSITDSFIDKDRLFVHTNKSLWALQTKPNQIVGSESTIFIGTGDFLSIPPRKLVSTEYGYAGSTDKWATIVTEHGTFFIDSNFGKVFLFNNNLEEISQNGMSNWFEENLTLQFPKAFFKLIGLVFSNTEFTGFNSIGFKSVYDPRYKRIILSKKDFIPTDRFLSMFQRALDLTKEIPAPNRNHIYYDLNSKRFFRQFQNGKFEYIDFINKEYFKNKSWTLSYNAYLKVWDSFHSYLPNYMFNDNSTFYTFLRGYSSLNQNQIPVNYTWKHNVPNFQSYYNVTYPLVVDYIVLTKDVSDKVFESIQYISRVKRLDTISEQNMDITNETFTEFYCYNVDQITSNNLIKIKDLPYESVTFNKGVSLAKRVDNVFKISNNIRDIGINRNISSLFSTNWNDAEYAQFFDVDGYGNGYIDRVPNELSRSLDKNVYQRARMKGKYIGVRLFYLPKGNSKIQLQISNVSNKAQNR